MLMLNSIGIYSVLFLLIIAWWFCRCS